MDSKTMILCKSLQANGNGKSSKFQAVSLAMRGYILQYGKTLSDIYNLALDKETRIKLELDISELDNKKLIVNMV